MQYIDRNCNVILLPIASNDNDDLLSFTFPLVDLAFIRELKNDMRLQNSATGILLSSRRERRFFQEVMDAERYIMLRYFTHAVPEELLRQLKRHILDRYLFPRARRRKKPKPG